MVRQIGRTVLEHHRAAEQDIHDVEIVVGELCANVTRHARSAAGRYRVTLEHHADHVVLEVADGGRGFDPQSVPPVGEPRQEADGTLRHGGFGLHLVRSLTDRVDIVPSRLNGTKVRAEKRLTPARQESGG